MQKAIRDPIHRISGFGAMSQASDQRLTSIAEEKTKRVAPKYRSNAELEPSEVYTELIFLLAKNNCPTNMSMGESW